jgi:hypothetical protein
MWPELFPRVKKKCSLFFLIAPILFAACQPVQATAVPTSTAEVDCKSSWEQEKTDDNKNLTFILELAKSQFIYDQLNKLEEPILSTLTLNLGK